MAKRYYAGDSDDRKPEDSIDDDRLSVRKRRPRHDEARTPRGHKRAADLWPVRQAKADPNLGAPSDLDVAIWRETMRMMGLALACGISEDMRAAVRVAYRAIAGHEWEEQWTHALGQLLRLREQARDAERSRSYVYGADMHVPTIEGRPVVATTGAAIAETLRAWATNKQERYGVPVPAWVMHPRLADAIESQDTNINLGGAGGPNRGKTPETVAADIATGLAATRR